MSQANVLFFLDKSKYPYRMNLFLVSVWINSAAYYCFDQPTSLHNSLKDYFADLIDGDKFEIYFGGLYSTYALANIFLPFVSGRLRDTIGDRIVLILLCVIMIIGQSIFAYGLVLRNFWVMYLGRILVGWGIESCLATQNSLLSNYFKYDYLATVISVNQFFAILGTMVCMWYLPIAADQYGLIFAIMTGVYVNIFSLGCAIITFFFDRHAENTIKEQEDQNRGSYQGSRGRSNFWSVFGPQQISDFGKLYWMMAFFMAVTELVIICCSNVSVGLITERWLPDDPNAQIKAGRMNGMAWFAAGVTTPLFGVLVDRVGHRAVLSVVTSIILISSQLVLWYVDPLIGLILLGISFGMSYATIWSGFLNVVQADCYGKAFAYAIALYLIGIVIGPMIVGFLRSYYGEYFQAMVFLTLVSIFSLVLSIYLVLWDIEQDNLMDVGRVYNSYLFSEVSGHRRRKIKTEEVQSQF